MLVPSGLDRRLTRGPPDTRGEGAPVSGRPGGRPPTAEDVGTPGEDILTRKLERLIEEAKTDGKK
jgi:hypothetical protein